MVTDSEGGNIRIESPNGQKWELDAHQNTMFRIFTSGSSTNGNKVVAFSFYEDGTLQAHNIKDINGHQLSNKANTTDVKNTYAVKETYTSCFSANIAYHSENGIPCHGEITKKTDGRCDIHLQFSIISMNKRGSDIFSFISRSKLCTMLGVNSIDWDNKRTKVWSTNLSSMGIYTGYTGLLFMINSDYINFGRIYTDTGSAGSWQTSAELYNTGTIYSVDIRGALYS